MFNMKSEYLELVTHSPEQTQQIGTAIGKQAQSGDLILLIGDLGAGKTCFTQGIAWGTGFDGYASSPSFVLVREYHGKLTVYHIDLYRLDNIAEIAELGIDDYLYGEGICVIEWADKALDSLPQEYLLITFEHLTDNERRMRFEPNGPRYFKMIEQIKEKWN
jgi:tRNA threonylcarbamoyladenosine biosynthesis protein TsaE